jgi:HD-GYP domain-containing protein (c-di-GMP phosphodiesterase class II)
VDEAVEGYRSAIAEGDRLGDRRTQAEALRRLSVQHHHRGERDTARELSERSFAIAAEIGDEVLVGEALNVLANFALVRSHHEKYDGSGYPDRLRGDEIPLAAQIVCIADVYDAMTTTRSYRGALTQEEAIGRMEKSKHWWRPDVYRAFIRSMERSPRAA